MKYEQIIPGNWYFVAGCVRCQASVPVFPDPSKGAETIHFAYGGILVVACPHCGIENNIRTSIMRSAAASAAQRDPSEPGARTHGS